MDTTFIQDITDIYVIIQFLWEYFTYFEWIITVLGF